MDDAFGWFMGVVIVASMCFTSGMISYSNAELTMKQRAIDAGVACYVTAKESGKTDFKFNCDKENK